ncbi:conjugal transfer protein [Salmonella enterica]|nr:conjugal transfer protein [Salmonella enterica]
MCDGAYTVEEEQYALARLAKARAQNARKAELRAVLAQTV